MDETQDNLPSGDSVGEPVAALATLEQDTSPQFVAIVRKKIHRRTTVSQFMGFSWNFPRMLLLELVRMLGEILGSNPVGRERNK